VTTTVYLVRHAVHSVVDHVLVGRNQRIGLSSEGLRQASCLGSYFARKRIASIHSSPQLRARQTATSISASLGKPFLIVPEIDEVDAGDWTGRSFDELENDARWHRWNSQRESTRIPNGECMYEVQERIDKHLAHIAESHVNRRVVIVTHAEIIRAAILKLRGLALQDFTSTPVAPASVTTVRLTKHGGQIVRENTQVDVLVAA
jgi:broad specificity phosphatase PhoE